MAGWSEAQKRGVRPSCDGLTLVRYEAQQIAVGLEVEPVGRIFNVPKLSTPFVYEIVFVFMLDDRKDTRLADIASVFYG